MAETSQTPMAVDLEPVQLVGPDGTATAQDRYSRDLPPETLCWLYETMVVTRDLDVEFVNLQRQGELALFASCRGQEAAQVGAAACLRKTDWLFPQYRELGVFLVRGILPGHIGAAWRGTWHGGLEFTKKCCAPISVPVGTQGLHAVGAASVGHNQAVEPKHHARATFHPAGHVNIRYVTVHSSIPIFARIHDCRAEWIAYLGFNAGQRVV
jgi:2-oxoisovalerate dehydrogenase E1 component alpha subunit